MSISTEQHRKESPHQVRVAVITISDTRTKENDTSGKTIVDMLEQSGQKIVAWEIVPDEPARIRELIERFRSAAPLAPGDSPGAKVPNGANTDGAGKLPINPSMPSCSPAARA